MKNLKKIPSFNSEAEESHFWNNNDSSDYIDFSKAHPLEMPDLKPATRTISIRLPERLIFSLKSIAAKNDVPYQSLIKIYLSERVREEQAFYGKIKG